MKSSSEKKYKLCTEDIFYTKKCNDKNINQQ